MVNIICYCEQTMVQQKVIRPAQGHIFFELALNLKWVWHPCLKWSEMTKHLRRDDANPSENLRGSQPSDSIHN